jgi:hypothetical protein
MSEYTTPNAANFTSNGISDYELLDNAHIPKPGEIQFVLQRNASDHLGREAGSEGFGRLDDGAEIQTEIFAKEYFDKALNDLSPDERRHVKVLFFASPSELRIPTGESSQYKRAVDSAAATLRGISESLADHNIRPADSIINFEALGEPVLGARDIIYQTKSLVDLNILTESPDFVRFLINKAKETNARTGKSEEDWGRNFWILYENDEYKNERERFNAEGPADIAERMNWHITMVNNSMRYVFGEDPEARLVVWNTAMYDNIQPFLQQKVTNQWQAITHNGGVIIDVDQTGQATTKIGGEQYEFQLHNKDNISNGGSMENLKPIEDINLAGMLESDAPENEAVKSVVEKLKRHQHGRFILGPSGVGKTTFTENQVRDENGQVDWLDADAIWYASGALPPQSTEWWRKLGAGPDKYDIDELDERCDEVTKQAKQLGLWLIGASDNNIVPDAIVVPDWEQHVAQIKKRESDPKEYARLGGAKTDKLDQVRNHIKQIISWGTHGAPRFKSVKEATDYLARKEEE